MFFYLQSHRQQHRIEHQRVAKSDGEHITDTNNNDNNNNNNNKNNNNNSSNNTNSSNITIVIAAIM